MRLLLDECVDERLRHSFPGHECQTARFAKLTGLSNGLLLEAAEAAGFDVSITADREIPDQQNMSGRAISILILRASSNRLREAEAIISGILSAMETIRPGSLCAFRRLVQRLSAGPGQAAKDRIEVMPATGQRA